MNKIHNISYVCSLKKKLIKHPRCNLTISIWWLLKIIDIKNKIHRIRFGSLIIYPHKIIKNIEYPPNTFQIKRLRKLQGIFIGFMFPFEP